MVFGVVLFLVSCRLLVIVFLFVLVRGCGGVFWDVGLVCNRFVWIFCRLLVLCWLDLVFVYGFVVVVVVDCVCGWLGILGNWGLGWSLLVWCYCLILVWVFWLLGWIGWMFWNCGILIVVGVCRVGLVGVGWWWFGV